MLTFAADGEHCFIPKVTPGVATHLNVDYIEKPFCGVVLAGNRYVRLSEIVKATEEGPILCTSNDKCSQTNRYYIDEARTTEPYILIFQGPRQRKAA